VESVVADLSAQPFDEAEKISEKMKMLNNEINFDCCLIVHNAGTLGDLTKKSSELNDQIQWHEYLQTNLISTIHLNNKIFDILQNGKVIFCMTKKWSSYHFLMKIFWPIILDQSF
jgi:hypothetical protein